MKTTMFYLLLLLSSILSAQTIDNPPFKARSGSTSNITRIERTPESTRVYIHAIFRPHWWIKEEGNCYLEDATTGKKFIFKSAEGIELNKEVYMPASGELDYVLVFEPLLKETQTIHLLSPNDPEGNTYDISLASQKRNKISPLESIKGNWYQTSPSNAWEYGIYESVTIIKNHIYTNESVRKKGKRVEMVVKDKKSGNTNTLLITPQKDGNCKIQVNGKDESLYSKEQYSTPTIAADNGFGNFFQKDTTYFQGYIDGYDPRLGFETGLIYLSNQLTREDYPTVVQINPDGSFECKFIIYHPVSQSLTIANTRIPFYIEPGQTLTMYINWEALLARNRARDYYYPIKNITYMGPSASLSYLTKDCNTLFSYHYEDLSKSQQTLTPNQYKEHMQQFISQWKHTADSLIQIYQPSEKAIRLIDNKSRLLAGTAFFNFAMNRDYYAKQDTANQILKVETDESYYNFLKEMPLNDETVFADESADIFINRFEYMDPFNKIYTSQLPATVPTDTITYTYPEKTLLSFLKEKGVKLNDSQEKIRKRDEKMAGTTIRISIQDLMKDSEKVKDLFKQEEKLVKEFREAQIKFPKQSQEDIDKQFIKHEQRNTHKKDSIITLLCNEPNPILWQIAKVRKLTFDLRTIKSSTLAREYTDYIKKKLTNPVLLAEVELIYKKIHPEEEEAKTYQLPEGRAAEIFRNIIKNHPNKVLFVDFWATNCGPCRGGIEATANLRKMYKDHPEFQFIYITGNGESPENDYKQYVEKNLNGEASYYVTNTEYNYLRQLFHFNGIPHYELVEKDGSISQEELDSYNIQSYLEKRFKMPEKE